MSPRSENICDSSKCTARTTILKSATLSSSRRAWAADRHRFVACQEALEALQHVGREGEKDLGFRRRGITGHPDHPSSSVRPVCAARYGPSLRNTLHFGNTLDPR